MWYGSNVRKVVEKQVGCWWWRAAGVAGSEKQKEDVQRRRCYGRCCAAGGRWARAVLYYRREWIYEWVFNSSKKEKTLKYFFCGCRHVFWGGAARVSLRGQLALRCALPQPQWFRPVRAHTRRRYCCWGAWCCLFFLHPADVLVHDQRWAL